MLSHESDRYCLLHSLTHSLTHSSSILRRFGECCTVWLIVDSDCDDNVNRVINADIASFFADIFSLSGSAVMTDFTSLSSSSSWVWRGSCTGIGAAFIANGFVVAADFLLLVVKYGLCVSDDDEHGIQYHSCYWHNSWSLVILERVCS